MFRKQKAGFKWGLLDLLITQKTLAKISPKEGPLSGSLNGVMSLWLISLLMSRDSGGRKFKCVTHKLTPNQFIIMDRNHQEHS